MYTDNMFTIFRFSTHVTFEKSQKTSKIRNFARAVCGFLKLNFLHFQVRCNKQVQKQPVTF